jgi:transposase-like protein
VLVVVERGTNRTRMEVIADRTGATLVPALTRLVETGSTVFTDGHTGYNGLPAAGFSWRRAPHPKGGLKRGWAGNSPYCPRQAGRSPSSNGWRAGDALRALVRRDAARPSTAANGYSRPARHRYLTRVSIGPACDPWLAGSTS